jgi:type IV pilus assembly protein PilX
MPIRSSSPRSRLPSRAERGFSLIVSLMMLIVIIILGISGSQMAINEERGSRSDRDRQIAFQAAEAALKDAEFEIYGATGYLCTLPNQVNHGNMRFNYTTGTLTNTCLNEVSAIGFQAGCSTPPNAGLCTVPPITQTCNQSTAGNCPAYLDPSNVNFLADAQGTGNNHTVPYGTFTNRVYASQQTAGLSATPVSAYPPRYIIERVPKNTSFTSATNSSDSTAASGQTYMFRVTAMGFGANPNSQVVLQAIVATTY